MAAYVCNTCKLLQKTVKPTQIARCLSHGRKLPGARHLGMGTGKEKNPVMTSASAIVHKQVQPISWYCTVSEKSGLSGVKLSYENNRKNVKITFGDGFSTSFNSHWLCYHCLCNECKQPHSGQRLIDPTAIPDNLTLKQVHFNEDQSALVIEFNEHDHKASVTLDFLRQNDYSREARAERSRQRDPLYLTGMDKLPIIDYNVMNTNEGILSWLIAVNDYGAAIIKNTPTEDNFLEQLLDVKREGFKVRPTIGPLMPTIYGDFFVVEDVPKPVNVAYTNVHLDLHMDLIYYESAPGIQFLHCIRFDEAVQGGESVLLDSFLVAEEMRQRYPEQFKALQRIPVSFQKVHYERDSPVSMKYQKPVIVCNPDGKLTAVNWAPAFESPLSIPEEDLTAFYEAYKIYATMLKESPHNLVFNLSPGDVMSFNNRRVLHGRNSYELNGGSRKLRGAYMNIDEFKSQVETVAQMCGKPRIGKRVGNHDFF